VLHGSYLRIGEGWCDVLFRDSAKVSQLELQRGGINVQDESFDVFFFGVCSALLWLAVPSTPLSSGSCPVSNVSGLARTEDERHHLRGIDIVRAIF
jgi:hypothetical protein